MSLSLSRNIESALIAIFDEPHRSILGRRLVEEAANNLPCHEKSKAEDLDRVRLSI